MALALFFSPTPSMSVEQYNECIKRLNKAGAGHPPGRTYHACFGAPESVKVFDVWTSEAAFTRFGETLLPILAQLGVSPGEPQRMDLRNVIVPPAATPKRAPARRTPARRVAKKAKKSRARTAARRR